MNNEKENIKFLRDEIEQRLNGYTPYIGTVFDKYENAIRRDERTNKRFCITVYAMTIFFFIALVFVVVFYSH